MFLTCGTAFQELKLFSKPRESFRGSFVRENSRPKKLHKKALSATVRDLKEVGSFRSNDPGPHQSYSPSEHSTAATEPPPTVDSSSHSTAMVEEPIRGTGAWMQDAEFSSNDLRSMGWRAKQQSPLGQVEFILHAPSPSVQDGVHRAEVIGPPKSASKWRRLPKITSEGQDALIMLDHDLN